MLIDCIADLHGYYPKLDGGDLLIIAGDCTARDEIKQWADFFAWLKKQDYRHKILVAGNHDSLLENAFPHNQKEADELAEIQEWLVEIGEMGFPDFEYLCDSGTEFEGFKIWGSPWSSQFPGINPKCCAFTYSFMSSLKEKWDLIPDDIDILITHTPPYGYFDKVKNEYEALVGDMELRNQVIGRIKPKLHVFGHIHEWGGKSIDTNVTKFINCSYVNERYEPVNKPIRIEL